MTDLPAIRTAPIPTPSQIRDINAGVMAGSRYHNALAETWALIRAEYDARMASHYSMCRRYGADPDKDPAAAARLCHEVVVIGELDEAIEWVQTLESSVPCQNGAHTEISYFASEAAAAVRGAAHLDRVGVRRLLALREIGRLRGRMTEMEAAIAAAVATAREHGAPWSAIGAELGVSKQAAHERYGSR